MKTIQTSAFRVEPPDITIHRLGAIALIVPESPSGDDWCAANLTCEPWQMISGGIAVEPRCVDSIQRGATDDGLEVA